MKAHHTQGVSWHNQPPLPAYHHHPCRALHKNNHRPTHTGQPSSAGHHRLGCEGRRAAAGGEGPLRAAAIQRARATCCAAAAAEAWRVVAVGAVAPGAAELAAAGAAVGAGVGHPAGPGVGEGGGGAQQGVGGAVQGQGQQISTQQAMETGVQVYRCYVLPAIQSHPCLCPPPPDPPPQPLTRPAAASLPP
jgi:hypothetical protein